MKNFILYILFLSLLSSCQSAGFTLKEEVSDEFLVEKKNPLVMPPDYENLPEPKMSENNKPDKEIKELIVGTDNQTSNSKFQDSTEKNFEEKLIKKIEQN